VWKYSTFNLRRLRLGEENKRRRRRKKKKKKKKKEEETTGRNIMACLFHRPGIKQIR